MISLYQNLIYMYVYFFLFNRGKIMYQTIKLMLSLSRKQKQILNQLIVLLSAWV